MSIETTLAAMLERAEQNGRAAGLSADLPRVVRALQRVVEECEGVRNEYIDGQCSPGRWNQAKSILAIITEEVGK